MPALVQLRPVEAADLPVFFAHQADVESARLAAFNSRSPEAFAAHWAKILANPDCAIQTIVHAGQVVGNICAWTDAETKERLVGYWIGRDSWGRGFASAALANFLAVESTRPLTARVAKHNRASVRVLQKCGFVITGGDQFAGSDGHQIEELILTLSR